MWIITENGDAVDLSKVVLLTYSPLAKEVQAVVTSNRAVALKKFADADEAKKFIMEIARELNGDKKVGYSFSWLKKSTPANETPDTVSKDALWF